MGFTIIPAFDYPEEVKALFTEYTKMLVEGDPSFQAYLDLQNYDEEVRNLKMKYDYPMGRLYLALEDGKPAGCIGLKRIDQEHCEMKRLYVCPEFRGRGLSQELVDLIVSDAREIGYKHMLLDTLPFLQAALHLYKKNGFYEIDCYNDSPMDTSIFMKLDL